MSKIKPKISIVVLNWNGWEDTIECIKSLSHLNYKNHEIVIVDNGSSDESLLKINEYIESQEKATGVNYLCNRTHLIKNNINAGYAGGNNVGIKFALEQQNADAVWILNNDTLVTPESLSEMIDKIQKGFEVVGSQIRYSSDPNMLWCEGGGYYSPWTMVSSNASLNENVSVATMTMEHEREIEKRLGYIAGASILFSRAALEKVGLFSEEYFLYFEEPDWFNRAKIHNIKYGYASKSIIYHAVGRSTDKYNLSTGRFYSFRKMQLVNSIKFTLKFHKLNAIISIPVILTREVMHFAKFIFGKIKYISKKLIPGALNLPLRWHWLRFNGNLDRELIWIKNYYKNKPGSVGVDIGANLGFYSYGLRNCFSEIHAFEPIKAVTRFLNDCKFNNIIIHNAACSDDEGISQIYIPRIKNRKEHSYAGLDVNDRHKYYDSIEITKTRLDSYELKNVAFIKIDVEGYEQKVLQGAYETIKASHPILLIELENRHRENAVHISYEYLIENFGYQGYFLSDNKLVSLDNVDINQLQRVDADGEPIQPYVNNFIFIRQKNI